MLSARSAEALRELADRLAGSVGEARATDVGYSLAVTRAALEYRVVLVGDGPGPLRNNFV
ncbi:hypothetical protein TU94_22445 [Streptomyces cyaneogriseus subsp. noncyanogenus]|uniref:Uncharacterized protein n=1 Tax=Streptomyces cyaneogriseus subsp. noncyanogenus TaxID=477245 RepID=A0A0C5G6C1_9ACTN|nr:hypothetical protein TU94_22445 [Streptomyces cyaneogriseus subsp. noncyanogenus]